MALTSGEKDQSPLPPSPHDKQHYLCDGANSDDGCEWVLVVPKRFTQTTSTIILNAQDCIARPWHLEGRYGGRIHPHDSDRMGIPVLSKSHVLFAASKESISANNHQELLRELLETPGVEIIRKPYTRSKRRCDPPFYDARIHPEREGPPRSSVMTMRSATNDHDKGSSSNSCSNHNNERICASAAADAPDQQQSKAALFTYAELFAGIGGFSVALEALGGKCVFASEIEEACRDVFTANFPDVPSHCLWGDIYQVTDDELLPLKIDLLVAGFPCQPFSALGKQPGFDCPKGILFLEIVRVLKACRPQALLLENVPGLLLMEDELCKIVSALEEVGYSVLVEVCDARGLTAATRKRLFFLGLRNDLVDSDNPVEIPYVPDLGLRAQDVLDYAPLTKAEEDLFRISDEQLHRLNSEKYWKPAHLAWPNVTLTTLVSHYGKAIARGDSQLVPSSAYARHCTNPRRFTPRECARLMGFPHRFIIPDKKRPEQPPMGRAKEMYRMFGNAVCPPLIAALAGALLQHCREMQGYDAHRDWILWARETAIRLAHEATTNLVHSRN